MMYLFTDNDELQRGRAGKRPLREGTGMRMQHRSGGIRAICPLFQPAAILFLCCTASLAAAWDGEAFRRFQSARMGLPETGGEVSLVAVGDMMLSRFVAKKIARHCDTLYPFRKVRDYLREADITFGNLECPIAAGRKIGSGEMTFRADPGMENALTESGFNVLSLANNHVPNFGDRGIRETLAFLDEAGIKHTGAGWDDAEAYAPAFVEAQGLTFAFLAYNDTDVVPPSYEAKPVHAGTAFMNVARMVTAVREAKRCADFVVVSMHSGYEYAARANASQTFFGRTAIDSGADLVIGHHPHVVQPVEYYRGKFIFYSLGNFIFDQVRAGTREGLMAEFVFDREGVTRIHLLPVAIEEYCRPRIAAPEEKPGVLERLKFPLADRWVFTWNDKHPGIEQHAWKSIYVRDVPRGNRVKTLCADLDRDNTAERYILRSGRLKVTQGTNTLWESPENWWVDGFMLEDSTNDGISDLNLSVWRERPPGSPDPFEEVENTSVVGNYFCVYAVCGGKVAPLWTSGVLPAPIYDFAVADVDNDTRNEIAVAEGSFSHTQIPRGETLTVWRWNGNGFNTAWQSPRGAYGEMNIRCMEEAAYVCVDSTAP